jgi:DNA-binding SARP family transcriptional activator/streptogramin lyase
LRRFGEPFRIPAGRERALLAVLALRRGEVVSTDALVDALWGDEPPSTAPKALQGYVSHLRRLLDPAGDRRLLVTQQPGYVFRIEDGAVDAWRFESLAARGWRELHDDAAAALATFEEALGLWRGPALGDFAYAEFAQRELQRLEELRLETVEGRLEAMLRLGRHGAVVAELESRVDEHPLRERLRGQLMLALYRSGRQAEALEVYRNGRRLLADELGLEPGTELQRLERAILAQDPALEVAERPAARRGPPPSGAHSAVAAGRRRVRMVALGVVLLLVAVASATLGYLLVAHDSPAAVATPPALVVVDPETNRVVASIAVGSRPVAIAADRNGVWVGDARDGTVTRVDPETRRVVKTIGVGAPVVDIATGVGGVWAATGEFGELLRIDPDLGALAQRITLGDPEDPFVPSVASVGVGDGRVWVGGGVPGGLARVDPASGDVVDAVDLAGGALQIAAGGGAVWTTGASRARRVEARSGRVTAEFYAGGWVYPIALGGGAAWVGGQAGVSRLDPDTGAALGSSARVQGVTGIAFGAHAVWITSVDAAAVVRLHPQTGSVEARIPTGAPGFDLVVHDGLVWVVVPAAPSG